MWFTDFHHTGCKASWCPPDLISRVLSYFQLLLPVISAIQFAIAQVECNWDPVPFLVSRGKLVFSSTVWVVIILCDFFLLDWSMAQLPQMFVMTNYFFRPAAPKWMITGRSAWGEFLYSIAVSFLLNQLMTLMTKFGNDNPTTVNDTRHDSSKGPLAIIFPESRHFIRSYRSWREDGVTISLSNNAYASVGCLIKGMLLKDKFWHFAPSVILPPNFSLHQN